MNHSIFKISSFSPEWKTYLPFELNYDSVYQSAGLAKHIEKRHPECLAYLPYVSSILASPDYIGVNPNEPGKSFELVKTFDNAVQIGIKLDTKNNYLYVATLHTITQSKLQRNVESGRLKRIDKE